jgi:SAM-dependent methyltransferase
LQEIGLTWEYVRRLTTAGERVIDVVPPLLKWRARHLREPAAYAMRMLMICDPVTSEQAQLALGDLPLEKLIDAGLVGSAADGWFVSPFYLNIVNGFYVICDDLTRGEDAVMGAGETTKCLCRASHPSHPIERALDLGCGAGTGALLFADRVTHIVGIDINPRAITLSRVNAALNGITNVDFREGDLFSPVEGETFDLIFSQPPYVAQPTGVEPRTFLYGGPRGDELPLKVLARLPRYLRPSGRAVILVEWPEIGEAPLEERVRAALPAKDLNVLILKYPSANPDDYCTGFAGMEHPQFDDDFERKAWLRRDHFEKMKIRALTMTLIVIERRPETHVWIETFEIPAQNADEVKGARIDQLIAARSLLAAGRPDLLAARLRVPEGTIFAREYTLSKPDAPRFTARFPSDALVGTVELNSGALLLLSLLHEAPDVRSAVERFAARETLTFEEAMERITPGVENALLAGMLEVT